MVDLSEECLNLLNSGHFAVVEPGFDDRSEVSRRDRPHRPSLDCGTVAFLRIHPP